MRVRPNSVIHLTSSFNPHRRGTGNHSRWLQFREGMTVTEFLAASPNGRRYLQHALERNIITVDGAVAVQTRAVRAIDASTLAPLSSDLSSLTFGVEIECILPRGLGHMNAARLVTEAGVDCRAQMYGHDTTSIERTWWKVVTDGSLGVDYSQGAEFVSPPLRGEEGLRQVEKVCAALLTSVHAKITARCGFHVHVGIGYADTVVFQRAVKLYADHEALLDSIQPESRRASVNTFCRSLNALEEEAVRTSYHSLTGRFVSDTTNCRSLVEAVMAATSREDVIRALSGSEPRGVRRYKKLNLASWWSYRTTEFRHHSGTVEADKASFWVKLCLRFMLFAQSNSPLPAATNLEDLLVALGCPDDERAFYAKRAAKFAAAIAARTRRAA